MAIYEYYCPTCREKFEQRRPMSEASAKVTCGAGHTAERTVSMFAMARTGGGTALADESMFGGMDEMGGMGGGGCCGGGGCACGA